MNVESHLLFCFGLAVITLKSRATQTKTTNLSNFWPKFYTSEQ